MLRCFLVVACIAFGCRRPVELATLPAGARLLGTSEGRVFWLDPRSNVVAWLAEGAEEPTAFQLQNADWANRNNFAADRTSFYFSSYRGVDRYDLEPTIAPGTGWTSADGRLHGTKHLGSSRFDAGTLVTGMALDGSCAFTLNPHVQCFDDAGGVLAFSTVSGHKCTGRAAPVKGIPSLTLRVDAQAFYWIEGSCGAGNDTGPSLPGTIWAAARNGGEPVVIAREGPSAHDLQLGPRGLYWATSGAIRFSAAGREAAKTVYSGEFSMFIADAAGVYIATNQGVVRLEDDGTTLVTAAPDVSDIAADARFLFWVERTGNRLMRLPR